MGAFNINITGVGGHGCERQAKAGEKLFRRCGRFTCPDCLAYEFTQRLKQAGMIREGDVAYSVLQSSDIVDAIKAKGLLATPTFAASRAGEADYFKVEDREFVPDGAASLGVSLYPDGRAEVYAQYHTRAEFTHWPGDKSAVVDDMLRNERASGQF